MRLLILGAGQYGYVVYDIAVATGLYSEISFLDDNSPRAIGKVNMLEALRSKYDCCVIAIGNAGIREKLYTRAIAAGYNMQPVISPLAYVSPTAEISDGVVIEPMAVINANSKIGICSFICASAVVNHNAAIGSFCHIDCSTVISARASVASKTKTTCGETIYEESQNV